MPLLQSSCSFVFPVTESNLWRTDSALPTVYIHFSSLLPCLFLLWWLGRPVVPFARTRGCHPDGMPDVGAHRTILDEPCWWPTSGQIHVWSALVILNPGVHSGQLTLSSLKPFLGPHVARWSLVLPLLHRSFLLSLPLVPALRLQVFSGSRGLSPPSFSLLYCLRMVHSAQSFKHFV